MIMPADPIHICGEALIDFVPTTMPDGQQAYIPKPGGSPYNVAVAAARAGGKPRFIGALSTDLFGVMLHDHLAANGVDCRHVQPSDRLTTLAFVDMSTGTPRYAFHNEGTANRFMTPALADPGSRSILHVGSISLIPTAAGERIAALARRHLPHGIISIDPNVRSALLEDRSDWLQRLTALCDHATIVKLSREDIAFLHPGTDPDSFALDRLRRGSDLVIVTGDSEGAFATTAAGTVRINVTPRRLRDTVGAGDTLMGATLAWLARRRISERATLRALTLDDLERMLGFAVAAASLNCEVEGCEPPTRAAIEARLASDAGVTRALEPSV